MSKLLKTVTNPLLRVSTSQKRVIFVGAKRSAKTTSFGLWALSHDLRSLDETDNSFSYYIEEKTSGICQVPADLCQGVFPEETPSGLVYEAIMHIRERKGLREKNIIIPVCETAGEDMENLIGPYSQSVYKQNPDWASADVLNKYICNSNGYIVTLPVSEVNIPLVPAEFRDTRDEPQDNVGHFVDPDLVAKRILSAIFAYKEKNKQSPPIEGIAILLTKADKVLHFIKGHGMDLNTPEGQRRFLTTYFRQTCSVLKYYGLDKVRFFPVFVEVLKIKGPDGKTVIYKDENNKKKILRDEENNLPIFSKTAFNELTTWVLQTFG